MSIVKPFTFVAATKARANEVNDNFDVLYSQVNSNISTIEQNTLDISNLSSNKADINGNPSETFQVEDATNGFDAINKQTMMKYLGNIVDYISGLTIEKDSGSPDDTILVNPGSCYDSTKQVILKLDVTTSKQNLTQLAGGTYYVYIIGNATGSQTDILISTNSTVPTLPSGYTLYRQIGYYTTDTNNKISTISYYGNSSISNNSPEYITSITMPDYSAGITVPFNTTYVCPTNGFVVCPYRIIINSSVIYDFYAYPGYNTPNSMTAPVSKGDEVLLPGAAGMFYPCKGGN